MRLIDADMIPNYKLDVLAKAGEMQVPCKFRIVHWKDIEAMPTIDPESLPVVQQLRAELERLKEGPAFNVGDSVWQTDGIDVYELEVKRLIYDCGYIAFDASAIGKRIFKTSSEAEAAMAKAKEAAHE